MPKAKTPILRNASNSINALATASRGNPSSDVSSRRVLPLVDEAGGSQERPTLPTLDAFERHLETFGPRARAGNLSARVQEETSVNRRILRLLEEIDVLQHEQQTLTEEVNFQS